MDTLFLNTLDGRRHWCFSVTLSQFQKRFFSRTIQPSEQKSAFDIWLWQYCIKRCMYSCSSVYTYTILLATLGRYDWYDIYIYILYIIYTYICTFCITTILQHKESHLQKRTVTTCNDQRFRWHLDEHSETTALAGPPPAETEDGREVECLSWVEATECWKDTDDIDIINMICRYVYIYICIYIYNDMMIVWW